MFKNVKNPFKLCLLAVFVFGFLILISNAGSANASKPSPLPVVQKNHKPVCPGPASAGNARCNARVVTDSKGKPLAATSPYGYGPLEFHTAYNLPVNATSGNPIIAIVDAYDNPSAYSDLSAYSSVFGIPVLPQCVGSIASSSVACFAKIDQNGGTSYPRSDTGWGLEIALDIQTAHAICQNCKILLVEAASNSFGNLLTAENQAAAQGAMSISNSWSAGEFGSETSYDSYFNHPGIAITAASGDSGYSAGTQYPAASPYVISIGGTTLQINSDYTYNNETVWNGTGSGCSIYEPKPVWQTDSGCLRRTLNDVSADADPSTGAAVYDSSGYGGWVQVGGTSLATPIIASVYALAGVTPSIQEGSVPYANAGSLRDVTNGNNGSCSPLYLCTALGGFDGPTGLGTPNGLGGFTWSTATPSPTLTPTPSPTSGPTPTPTLTLTPTPQPVSVTITNPLNGSTVPRNSLVTIKTNTSSNVTQVKFTVNGSLICTDSSLPFSCNWYVPRGYGKTYTIKATAINGIGGSAQSSVNVTAR